MISNGLLAPILGAALGCLSPDASTAAELAQGDGRSLHLGPYDGVLYYTVEERGFRVVATLASASDEPPIRFASSLEDGQHIVISVPRAVGLAPMEFEILRTGDVLLVNDKSASETAEITDKVPTSAAR
jgi:hypothetical protein